MPPATPLLRPGTFFTDRDPNGGHALVLTLLHLISVPLAVWGVGQVLKARVDGTVMVDNPNRPSEQFCEHAAASMDVGCDAPAQIERNIDAILADAIGQLIGPALLGVAIVLVLVGGALHVGAWTFNGENGVGTSFAVALWGLVPSLVGLVVGAAVLFVVLDPLTVTTSDDPAVMAEWIRTELAPLLRWQPLFTGATTLWSAIIWRSGLVHSQGLDNGSATLTAGTIAVLFWILSLV